MEIERKTFLVQRDFITYQPEDFDDIAAYLDVAHGVSLNRAFSTDSGTVMMQSISGSTSYYFHPGDVIVIDEIGDVRPLEQKDKTSQTGS